MTPSVGAAMSTESGASSHWTRRPSLTAMIAVCASSRVEVLGGLSFGDALRREDREEPDDAFTSRSPPPPCCTHLPPAEYQGKGSKRQTFRASQIMRGYGLVVRAIVLHRPSTVGLFRPVTRDRLEFVSYIEMILCGPCLPQDHSFRLSVRKVQGWPLPVGVGRLAEPRNGATGGIEDHDTFLLVVLCEGRSRTRFPGEMPIGRHGGLNAAAPYWRDQFRR
jgi:hypothetical protein